jgi:hypothetical protein
MTMSEDELDSEEDAQYGDEEESSDEPPQEISDDDESEGGEDAEGDDADDDSPSDPDASDAPFNNISRSQQGIFFSCRVCFRALRNFQVPHCPPRDPPLRRIFVAACSAQT